MRHAATLAVGFGLVALCIHTSALRGRLWLADAAIERCVREELRLEEAIRNARVRRQHDASLSNLASALRDGALDAERAEAASPLAVADRRRLR